MEVPSFVKFLTPASGLQGYWDPYPIDMEFRPPCMASSTIGISNLQLRGRAPKSALLTFTNFMYVYLHLYRRQGCYIGCHWILLYIKTHPFHVILEAYNRF
ncbi:hypothetical protein HAX54_030737 [Datura stramonium]|uniref:Uncharacterized protein n=1 Tax=Datura stramonium TaxID=4076 RepID=A0ABS8VBJ7_DATST|nr:hypothetical protein [Datura stramonium]